MTYKFNLDDSKSFLTSYAKIQNILIYGGFWSVLSSGTKAMYPVLVAHTKKNTGKTFVGIERISVLSGLSKPTVRKGVKELKTLGLLVVKKAKITRGRNVKTRNFYSLTLPPNVLDPNYLNSTPLKEVRRAMAQAIARGDNFLAQHADSSGFIQEAMTKFPLWNVEFLLDAGDDDIPF